MSRVLPTVILFAALSGCTFDTSGVPFTGLPSADIKVPVDAGPGTDQPRADQLQADQPLTDMPRLDLPLTDTPLPDGPLPDVTIPDAPSKDMPLPDAPVADAPTPDMPLPDQFVWPDILWPDGPLPDMPPPDQNVVTFPDQNPWPDHKIWPDLVPHDTVPHDLIPFPPDFGPFPACSTLFGWVDGYKKCKETAATCLFWHDEGAFGGSYSCNTYCKTKAGKKMTCIAAYNTGLLDKCGTYSKVSCSSTHNNGACLCQKF